MFRSVAPSCYALIRQFAENDPSFIHRCAIRHVAGVWPSSRGVRGSVPAQSGGFSPFSSTSTDPVSRSIRREPSSAGRQRRRGFVKGRQPSVVTGRSISRSALPPADAVEAIARREGWQPRWWRGSFHVIKCGWRTDYGRNPAARVRGRIPRLHPPRQDRRGDTAAAPALPPTPGVISGR